MTFRKGIDSRPFSNELGAQDTATFGILSLAVDWEVTGVDISYWQGDIDFSVMKGLVDFVVMRYAYGNSTVDARLDAYYKGATDNNIAIMAYHYLKPGKNWETHAQTDCNLLQNYPALYLWGDAEETGGLGKSDLDSWFYKYYNKALELTGGSWEEPTIGIYTSPNFWNTYMPRTDWAKKLKLWNAHWTAGATPILPYDWSVPGKPWTLWQYSSKGDGKMHGASSTYIDLNRYNGSRDNFNSEFGASLPPPEPPQSDYKKVKSLHPKLRVRNAPSLDGLIKDYMYLGTTTEALEEYISGNDKWIRVGYKQWSAMYLAGVQYLEYVV